MSKSDPDAAKKFQEISEAYEVNKDCKALYANISHKVTYILFSVLISV